MTYGTVNADVISTSTSGGVLGAGNASLLKNRLINGAMVINQRGTVNTPVTPTARGYFASDRWLVSVTTASKFSIQQSSDAPTGFTNSLLVTSLSAYTPTSTDEIAVQYRIEGYNVADLGFGSASAKTVTISFLVKSSVTGTYGASLSNGAFNRWYPFSYSIPVANTWTQISVTIVGDTTGTWTTDNTTGFQIEFGLGVGSTLQGAAGAWTSSVYVVPTGSRNIVSTNGGTIQWTGVQLEVGSSATGFEYRQIQQELALCQRYLPVVQVADYSGTGMCFGASNARCTVQFPVPARVAPTGFTTTGAISMTQSNGGGTGSIVWANASTLMASISATGLSGLTAGNATALIGSPNSILFTGCEL